MGYSGHPAPPKSHTPVTTKLEVHNSMNLSGRGAVLIGFIHAGTACVGQMTPPLTLGGKAARRLEVIAVERLSSMGLGKPAVGLIFKNPPPIEELKMAFPSGSIVTLDDPA